jgi:hypothetical protein
MANSLIEGPIPLTGPGFVAKENGNFQPGEFKRLNNVEVDRSGVIVNRRNVYSVHGENTGAAVTPITNPQRFIGNMGEYTIITNGTDQYIVGAGTVVTGWNTFSGPAGGASYSRFLGFFRYNNKNYWLVLEFNSGVSIALALYYDAGIPVPDIPTTYVAGYQAGLTREVILSFASGTTDFYDFQFRNFFIYKERLWIATSVGLYFSASTDPTDFVVPNGGFFKYPGNKVNWAFAIKDNVYTLCEDAVYALTYSTDPNVDSSQRPLSSSIGGEMGCIHLDTPYFINNLGIFSINGHNVDKVMDSRFDYGQDAYSNRIFSFEEYLVVNKYSPVNYDNNYSPPARVTTRRNLWPNPESDTVGGTQIATGWSVSGSPAFSTRTNKAINPSVERSPFAYWYAADSSVAEVGQDAVEFYTGTKSGYVKRLDSFGSIDLEARSEAVAVSANTQHTVSVYVRPPFNRTVRLRVYFLNGADVVISNSFTSFSVDANVWTRLSKTITTTPSTAKIYIQIEWDAVNGTSKHYWDAALIEETSTLKAYFDGDSADDAFKTYAWSGVAHESASTLAVNSCVMDAVTTVVDGISPGRVLRIGGAFPNLDDLEGITINSDNLFGKGVYTLDTTTALVAGIPYTFRWDRKGSWDGTGTGSLYILLEYLSAADAVLGSRTVVQAIEETASYVTTTVDDIVFPATTEKLRVTFKFYLAPVSGAVTNWDLDFNRFHLEQATTYSGYFTGASTDTVDVVYNWAGVAYASESTSGSATTHSYLKNNGSKFEPFQLDNDLGYNTYFINTENGSTHVLDFMDQYVQTAHGGAGFIVDAIVNPYGDASGNYKMMFLTNKFISEAAGGVTYKGDVYYISSSEDVEVNDYAVSSTNVIKRRAPKIDIEIDSFVPDGHEYRVKKFRSILLQGVLPPSGMELNVGYDNAAYTQETVLGDTETVLTEPRRHYAHRVGLNQRGRSVTLRLKNDAWTEELTAPMGDLEISDLRVMWSPTQRLPVTKNIGS